MNNMLNARSLLKAACQLSKVLCTFLVGYDHKKSEEAVKGNANGWSGNANTRLGSAMRNLTGAE